MRWLVALVLVLVLAAPALAVLPDEVLDDPVLETRARAISSQLRCLVCQNQNIDESNAPLARDLRLLVRERLVLGDSDSQVVNYLVARFGEFILLKPYFALHTYALWFATPVVFGIAIWIVVSGVRRRRKQMLDPNEPLASLTEEESDVLATLDDPHPGVHQSEN